ncbi:dihydropteroate synthase [Microbacterium hydrocarbonoxydans]|uniref:Dihydropteroate synthase n=1 Tax=Microbacterium hydrocarbonoxydans TaxID=273678 RepID=A0A1H4QJQ4_9MICO|nr:dihydropteroate synthase [Microbacterium hydrocarbonoxydans]SEC19850.1 dihydropteroate synthase [Microbacterium hydrocarbonoxydans]
MTGIWGIVNVTPDSFSDGGRYLDVDRAVEHGLRMRADGATVLDVGGESTRPGAERVGADAEQERVLPVIERLVAAGAPVSIDTLNASTAAAAVRAGARIVNDVSGGLADADMLAVVAGSGADYAIGHWRGFSDDMYARAEYHRPAREVAGELQERVSAAAAAGIAPSRLIIDPGIGFAKAGAQNWDVLRGLDEIVALGPRVLVGTSRKRFLAETLLRVHTDAEVSEARRDLATAVTSALAARAGVWAVRVHDVCATRDALAIAHAWEG